MKYFLFTDHPKGGLDTVSEEIEERIRRYFSGIDTIETKYTESFLFSSYYTYL